MDTDNSASTGITDIKEAVAAGAKGIILNTIQESATSAAKEAADKGIAVITIDSDVTDAIARIAFIGDDDVTLGRDMTQSAIDTLKKDGVPTPWNVVVLQGTPGSSTAIGRLNGTMEVLKPLIDAGTVKTALNQSADFATDKAQAMISTLLAKTTKIQLVVCGNDAMALGALVIGVINDLTVLIGLPSRYRYIFVAVVLILAGLQDLGGATVK